MNHDLELWTCASTLLSQQGEQALLFVAERIGAPAAAGDEEGVAVWKAIPRAWTGLCGSRDRFNEVEGHRLLC